MSEHQQSLIYPTCVLIGIGLLGLGATTTGVILPVVHYFGVVPAVALVAVPLGLGFGYGAILVMTTLASAVGLLVPHTTN